MFASWDSRGGDTDKVIQKINHFKTPSRLEVKRSSKTDDFTQEKKNDLIDGLQHQGWDTTSTQFLFDGDNNIAVFCLLPTRHICF